MRPMSEFDPSRRCCVPEQLNRKIFAWDPERAEHYRANAVAHAPSVINWDRLMLDGWWPWDERPVGAVEEWP